MEKKWIISNGISILLLIILLCPNRADAQNLVQSIKGRILDKSSQQPIIGAAIYIPGKESQYNALSDIDGNFEIRDIPVGRISLEAKYIGYESWLREEINLSSAATLYLDIEMVEMAYTTETVTVTAKAKGSEPLNEMTMVSARSFTVEETSRYASSVNDPGRMVLGFPGVQPSRDVRNDFIIRGNSPAGMLWRLEGIDIPNPNHFARKGSSGGGITIFSASMLGSSDFSSGAFPAEYGNAFSGFMDVHFRKGNDQERKHTFRAGILGLDFATEGPIKKGKSSYLINYRYSTLGILNKMGIHLVAARINNTFHDLSFNIATRSDNNKHLINFWAISGASYEDREPTDENPDTWRSFDDYNVYTFNTKMAAGGVKHTYLVSNSAYWRTSVAAMVQDVLVSNDTMNVHLNRTPYNYERYINGRLTLSTFYNKKFSAKATLKTGVMASILKYDLNHRILESSIYRDIILEDGNSFLIQPYIQTRISLGPKTVLAGGFHGLFWALNNSFAVDPRLSVKHSINAGHTVSLAIGQHSATVPIGSYFTRIPAAGGYELSNIDLELIKSYQAVLSYGWQLSESWKLTLEPYFQYLTDVPVAADINSTYYMLNDYEGFVTREVISEGTGRNIGIDIIVERFFRKGTYLISSVSLFDSKYRALNGNWYNTLYNSNISGSLMAGKEWALSNNQSFSFGTKILFNNGILLTPLDENAPVPDRYTRYPQLDESRAFTDKITPFFRPDIRLAWSKNNPKNSFTLSLDVQNVINRTNIDGLLREYDPDTNTFVYRVQSSITPIITFQINF